MLTEIEKLDALGREWGCVVYAVHQTDAGWGCQWLEADNGEGKPDDARLMVYAHYPTVTEMVRGESLRLLGERPAFTGFPQSTKCPNCGALGLTAKDHDTGKPSPDKWVCDSYEIERRPNTSLTYDATQQLRFFLRFTCPMLARLLDEADTAAGLLKK